MHTYYVTIRSKNNFEFVSNREERFQADDFAHAEEQAKQNVEEHEQIVKIELDYE